MTRRVNFTLRMPRYLASTVAKRSLSEGLSMNEFVIRELEAALPYSKPVHMRDSADGYRLPDGERHPAVGAE